MGHNKDKQVSSYKIVLHGGFAGLGSLGGAAGLSCGPAQKRTCSLGWGGSGWQKGERSPSWEMHAVLRGGLGAQGHQGCRQRGTPGAGRGCSGIGAGPRAWGHSEGGNTPRGPPVHSGKSCKEKRELEAAFLGWRGYAVAPTSSGGLV